MNYIEVTIKAKICFKGDAKLESLPDDNFKRLVINDSVYMPEMGFIKYDNEKKNWVSVNLDAEKLFEPGYQILISHEINELDELPEKLSN